MKTFTATISLADLQKIHSEYQFSTVSEQEIVFSRLREKFQGGGDYFDASIKEKQMVLTWGLRTTPPDAERFNKEALDYARSKEYAKAITTWQKTLTLASKDPDIYYNLGLIYFETKEYNRGIDKLMETIRLCPIYHRAYFVLGSIYSKTRQFKQAEQYLLEGLLLQANNLMAMINLAAVYSILKNYKEAIRIFEKTIALSPKEIRSYLGLGKVYMAQGDMDNASRYFKAVIKLEPEGKFAEIARKSLRGMAPEPAPEPAPAADAEKNTASDLSDENCEEIYAEGFQSFIRGDLHSAVTAYQRYLLHRPAEADVWASLASCQLRLGYGDAAMESIRNAIRNGPGKAVLHKQAAIIFDACDRINEAGRYANKAIELGKSDSITMSLAGKAHIHSGDLEDAERYLQEALKLNPNNLQARYHFAQLMKKLGQTDSARQNLEEILWAHAETPLKEKARREIQALS